MKVVGQKRGRSTSVKSATPKHATSPAAVLQDGQTVVVSAAFESMTSVRLKPGQKGVIQEIDEAGDLCVDFEDHSDLQWIDSANAKHLEVAGLKRPSESAPVPSPPNGADPEALSAGQPVVVRKKFASMTG